MCCPACGCVGLPTRLCRRTPWATRLLAARPRLLLLLLLRSFPLQLDSKACRLLAMVALLAKARIYLPLLYRHCGAAAIAYLEASACFLPCSC